MIIGAMADTHLDKRGAIPYIVKDMAARGAKLIIHAGDMMPQHFSAPLFQNLPVIIALTDEQVNEEKKMYPEKPPLGWVYTDPKNRIQYIFDSQGQIVAKAYIGHKRAFEVLFNSVEKLWETLYTIRRDHDLVRYMFSGHTHHQIYMKNRLIDFINPGAVEDAYGVAGGYEYALIDTENGEVIFTRIPATKNLKRRLKLAVISDTLDISEIDPDFWKKLAEEFSRSQVTDIVICGNLNPEDIGKEELQNFDVWLNSNNGEIRSALPNNWNQLPKPDPKNLITYFYIGPYEFCINFDLGLQLDSKSERDLNTISLEAKKDHPNLRFMFFGGSHEAFYEEGQNLLLLDPGDVISDRSYATIDLPRIEITFGSVPYDSLATLMQAA